MSLHPVKINFYRFSHADAQFRGTSRSKVHSLYHAWGNAFLPHPSAIQVKFSNIPAYETTFYPTLN
jgi:hypothetical protein